MKLVILLLANFILYAGAHCTTINYAWNEIQRFQFHKNTVYTFSFYFGHFVRRCCLLLKLFFSSWVFVSFRFYHKLSCSSIMHYVAQHEQLPPRPSSHVMVPRLILCIFKNKSKSIIQVLIMSILAFRQMLICNSCHCGEIKEFLHVV